MSWVNLAASRGLLELSRGETNQGLRFLSELFLEMVLGGARWCRASIWVYINAIYSKTKSQQQNDFLSLINNKHPLAAPSSMLRKFGTDVENLVKEKSSNHIVLKSRSFSFDNKTKPPAHISRRVTLLDQKAALSLHPSRAPLIESPTEPRSDSLTSTMVKDLQLVPEYLKQCLEHLRFLEASRTISLGALKARNSRYLEKRGELVEWMVQLHQVLRLFAPTLFAAVNLMDQFCCLAEIEAQNLQMLAVTCLFVTAKYQETYNIPSLKDMQKASSTRAYVERAKIVEMEQRIFSVLDFKVISQNSLKFFQLFSKISDLSPKNYFIGQYVLELVLTDESFVEYPASILGAAMIYLVHKIRKISPAWPCEFRSLVGFEESELRPCAKHLCTLLERSQELPYGRAIRMKFSRSEFESASNIRLNRKCE